MCREVLTRKVKLSRVISMEEIMDIMKLPAGTVINRGCLSIRVDVSGESMTVTKMKGGDS